MLALLWGILKIVGLILLVIVGIILLLILLVLLVPIRYRVEGSFDGTPAGFARVTWLLHLISAKADYREELNITVRILGFRVFGMKLPEDPETDSEAGLNTDQEKKADFGEKRNAADHEDVESSKGEGSGSESKKRSAEKTAEKEEDRAEVGGTKTEEINDNNIIIEEAQPQISPFFITGFYDKFREKCIGKIEEILQKIRSVAAAVCEKLRAVRKKKDWLVSFLKNEDNKKTFLLMKRQFFRLVRHILPRRLSGRVKFGFDDPSTTGQILTYISPFYGLYAGKLELIPVFEEKALEGEVRLKGRVRILTVLWIAVRMLFDRNFRKLIRWFLDR